MFAILFVCCKAEVDSFSFWALCVLWTRECFSKKGKKPPSGSENFGHVYDFSFLTSRFKLNLL